MTQGRPDPEVIRRHLAALREALGIWGLTQDEPRLSCRAALNCAGR